MKLFSLNNRGVAYHVVLPILTVLAISIIGARILMASHAATPTFYQMLNSADAASTPGISQIQDNIQSLGTQTVSQVLPGAELDYLVYGKVPILNECYYFQILPLKGGGTTAKISFAGIGAAKTMTFAYDAAHSNFLQKVCVPTGTGTGKAYNVKNLSPVSGPAILVYQAEIAQPAQ